MTKRTYYNRNQQKLQCEGDRDRRKTSHADTKSKIKLASIESIGSHQNQCGAKRTNYMSPKIKLAPIGAKLVPFKMKLALTEAIECPQKLN